MHVMDKRYEDENMRVFLSLHWLQTEHLPVVCRWIKAAVGAYKKGISHFEFATFCDLSSLREKKMQATNTVE